jgi:hypothetical protein
MDGRRRNSGKYYKYQRFNLRPDADFTLILKVNSIVWGVSAGIIWTSNTNRGGR